MTDKQSEALRLADALSKWVVPNGTHLQAAALLRTQHAAIERKDALLKHALKALNLHQGAHPETYRQVKAAITRELQ